MKQKIIFYLLVLLCIFSLSCSGQPGNNKKISDYELQTSLRKKSNELAKSVAWAEKQLIRGGKVNHQFERYFVKKNLEINIAEFRYKVISDADIKKKKRFYYKSIQQKTNPKEKKGISVFTKSKQHPKIKSQRVLLQKFKVYWVFRNNDWKIEKFD